MYSAGAFEIVGQVLMWRLFSVHARDAAVSVCLLSICVGRRGAPAGSGLPCPGHASERWLVIRVWQYHQGFSACLTVKTSFCCYGGQEGVPDGGRCGG